MLPAVSLLNNLECKGVIKINKINNKCTYEAHNGVNTLSVPFRPTPEWLKPHVIVTVPNFELDG